MAQSTEERGRVLALLRHNHEFPCAYRLKAIVRADDGPAVVAAVAAAARILSVDERPSSKGAWVSVRLSVHAETAEAVLDLYDLLGSLDSVVTTL